MSTDITLKSGIKEFGFLLENKEAWLSTLVITDIFGKVHKNVLEKIDNILKKPDDFTERNFRISEYKDKSGKTNKQYLLNNKSFALVAMGFTGAKALNFKKQYINAFEDMRNLIETRELAKTDYIKMTDAIQKYIVDANAHTYSNEANMINKLVLGMTAKQFKESHNLKPTDANRDHYAIYQIKIWEACQIMNAYLISAKISFDQRREMLKAHADELTLEYNTKLLN